MLFTAKKWVCVGICVVFAIPLFVFAVTPAQAKDYKWKISQGIAEDHPAAARCKQLAKLVGEKSKGHITLDHFPSGTIRNGMATPFETDTQGGST